MNPIRKKDMGGMTRFILLISVALLLLGAAPSIQVHPLAPPDTNSPRTLLKSFMDTANKAYQLNVNGERKISEIDFFLDQAIRCLDLSKVAPSVFSDVGIESVLLLKEVLDRIEVPPYDQIPDRAAMKKKKYKKWSVPHTEITIALVEEGHRQGEYLFTADTVSRLKGYYKRVEHLPYKSGASVNAYEDYTLGTGWMIPDVIIQSLPKPLSIKLYDLAIWQWLSMLLIIALGLGLALLVFHRTRRKVPENAQQSMIRSFLRQILFPISLAIIAQLSAYLLDDQINMTGSALTAIIFFSEILFFIALVWIVNTVGNLAVTWLITKPSIHMGSIDANLIRICARIVTILVLFFILLNATRELGIPLTAIFASAGIVGLALALAARETIANLFGGINILMDRPFRAGHYIILDLGERGKVVEVGLRSTRIITQDDVQISIPNPNITNSKIINESVPKYRFPVRIKVGVAYGSDLDQVETVLLQVAKSNVRVIPWPDPRVRIRSFVDSAIDYELLCWANQPDIKGKLIHQLYRAVYSRFKAANITIPFPQRELHMAIDNKGHT